MKTYIQMSAVILIAPIIVFYATCFVYAEMLPYNPLEWDQDMRFLLVYYLATFKIAAFAFFKMTHRITK